MLKGLIERARNPKKRAELEAELAGPPLPAGAAGVWKRFMDLSAGRGGGFGPAPLSWSELAAWQGQRGLRLSDWELDLFRDLDAAYLRAVG